jgi:two-component system LytT family response regulator
MRFKTLIVDDEPLAREGLRMWLAVDPDVTAIAEARNGREAVLCIRKDAPDLVFLDVQMPEMDGFAVVKKIGAYQMPPVVFVTAHDKHAIQAFEMNAIDYLLKPVTEERFAQALARAKARVRSRPADETNRQIINLLETVVSPRRPIKRLAVRSGGKTVFVEVDDIDWIEAAENYVQLHCGKTAHLLHMPMGTLEKSLDPEVFLRVHRGIIVNVGQILELQSGAHGEYVITLRSGGRISSSRSYGEKLRALTTNRS